MSRRHGMPFLKKVAYAVALLLAVGMGFFVAKDALVNVGVRGAIQALTGLKIQMSYIHVHLTTRVVVVKDLLVLSPAGFQEPTIIDLPEILGDYKRRSFFSDRLHLEKLRINLRELVIERNQQGVLNIDAIPVVQAGRGRASAPKPMPIQIDVLELHLGSVIYKDYSQPGPPQVQEFRINLRERYERVTDLQALVALIVVKSVMNTTVEQLASIDLGPLKAPIGDLLAGAQALAGPSSK